MKQAPPLSGFAGRSHRAGSVFLPLGVLLVCGYALPWGWDEHRLEAVSPTAVDDDGDGLPNKQELVLGTDPHRRDTDLDGYTDGEELALQSSPLQSASTPDSAGLSVGITARGEQGRLKIFVAMHYDGILDDKIIRLAALVNGNLTSIPFERLLPYSDICIVPGANGGHLYTMDISLPPGQVHDNGRVTYFLAVGEQGSVRYKSAAKVDLTSKDGVILMRRRWKNLGLGGPVPLQQSGATTIHQPIPPEGPGAIPVGWIAGKVCLQTSQIVGTTGSFVLHEIVEAECDDGWDSYCEGDCEGTVGDTWESVDPITLLGG